MLSDMQWAELERPLALREAERQNAVQCQAGGGFRQDEAGWSARFCYLRRRKPGMDVILTPTGSKGASWSLKDRLGRHLGEIREDVGFAIIPAAGTGLQNIPLHHASLDAAMTAVAKHMAGACELGIQDWD